MRRNSLASRASYPTILTGFGRAPFGMAVSRQLHPPFDAEWHSIRVNLKYVSGVRTEAGELARRINQDIEWLFSTAARGCDAVERSEYDVRHVEDGDPRTLITSYGRDEHWWNELEALVYQTLMDKREQIQGVASAGHCVVLLMDCRALISPEPREHDEARQTHRAKFRERILHAGERFLQEHNWITGILWWWKRADWAAKLAQIVHEPWPVSLSTRGNHIELFDPADLSNAYPP
jgi:hypothetical protein